MEKNAEKINKAKIALLSMQRHSWEQGVAAQAFLEQGDMDIVIAMAKEAAYRHLADGRTAVLDNSSASTDPCSVGEALLTAAKITGDPELVTAHERLLNWALHLAPSNNEGVVYHFADSTQFWIDSMYMLPPYLASAGQYAASIKQIEGYCKRLFHPQKQMFSHMWDEQKQQYVREDAWGVGNGWAVAGITRVIAALPKEYDSDRQKLIDLLIPLIDTILTYMTPDGRFHDIIDNADTFLEVNLSQMLAYALFRGMKGGWLQADYLQYAEKLRDAANRELDQFGLVQNVCGAPHFDRPGVAPEGQAFYLLMEAAAKDYYTN